MVWVAGVDGCPRGWFRICRETQSGALVFDLLERPEQIWRAAPHPRVIAIDMPIGLPPGGPRACDRAARALLGARRSSVFPAPIRPTLVAADRAEASRIGRAIDGRGVGAQAFGIYPRHGLPEGVTVREAHPELCFRAWRAGQGDPPIAHSKRTAEGLAERLDCVEGWLGTGLIERARDSACDRPYRKKDLSDDDILDAAATLWTAHRIADGRAERVPARGSERAYEKAPLDEYGLPMEIVF